MRTCLKFTIFFIRLQIFTCLLDQFTQLNDFSDQFDTQIYSA